MPPQIGVSRLHAGGTVNGREYPVASGMTSLDPPGACAHDPYVCTRSRFGLKLACKKEKRRFPVSPVALFRAPPWRRGGRGFESRRGHPIQPFEAGKAREEPSQLGGFKVEKGRWITPLPPLPNRAWPFASYVVSSGGEASGRGNSSR